MDDDLTRRDLTERDLTGRDLTGRDLPGRDLTGLDLAGLDEALRAALGPESALWPDDFTDIDATAARDAVVHGVRRRRARRFRAVSALAAMIVAIGLVVSQVVAASTPAPASHGTRSRADTGTGGTAHGASDASVTAECKPQGATTRPCGTLAAATGTDAPAGAAAGGSATPTRSATPNAAASPAISTSTGAVSPSHVLDLAVGQRAAVRLPEGMVWTPPTIIAAAPAGKGPVVTVHAPVVTGVTASHGWEHFVVEGTAKGTAIIQVTGSCSPAGSCSGGHSTFVLEVNVGGA